MSELRKLRQYTYRLYIALLKEHIKSTSLTPTPQEEDGVKAYCVLTHAAIEEYFESISLKMIKNAYKKYKTKSFISSVPSSQIEVDNLNIQISQLLKTLILTSSYTVYSKSNSDALKEHKNKLEKITEIYKSGNSLTLQDVTEVTKKTDSYTKELIKEAVKFYEKYVDENHGASLKYMLKLLIPVGIDIPDELNSLNSLQRLAEYRGNYAHSQGNLSQILSSKDIVQYLIDVIKLCTIIEDSVLKFDTYSNNTNVAV